MKNYTWTLTRKFPFIKKRSLTQLELIQKHYNEMFNILPMVYIVGSMGMMYGLLKNLVKR